MRDLHFLLQKEVVDRLSAAYRAPKTGAGYRCLTQYCATVEPLFDVGPEHFRPPPKVMSTFVRIMPKPKPVAAAVARCVGHRATQCVSAAP